MSNYGEWFLFSIYLSALIIVGLGGMLIHPGLGLLLPGALLWFDLFVASRDGR